MRKDVYENGSGRRERGWKKEDNGGTSKKDGKILKRAEGKKKRRILLSKR